MTTTKTRPNVARLKQQLQEVLDEADRLRETVLLEPMRALALAPERQLLDTGARYLQEAIARAQSEEDDATREVRIATFKANAARLADDLDALTSEVETHADKLLELSGSMRKAKREFQITRKALLDLGEDVDRRYTPLVERKQRDYVRQVQNAVTTCANPQAV